MDDLRVPQAGGPPPFDHAARARSRLLRAAADVFDRKGYEAASVREIVEQAGATKPVLYYYFGSKEGLLVAILEEGARQFQAALDRAVGQAGSARQRLAALCEEVCCLMSANAPAVRIAHAVYFGPRAALPPFDLAQFGRMLDGALRRVIEDGIASGEIRPRPVEDIMTAVRGLIEVCTDRELSRSPGPAGSGGLGRILDIIYDGLSAARDDKEN